MEEGVDTMAKGERRKREYFKEESFRYDTIFGYERRPRYR